jgi:hypothetical protein
MDIQSIVAQLREEASRIEQAIAALVGFGYKPARRGPGRPAGSKSATATSKPQRRTMSASARAKISAAQKARWAKQKGTSSPKTTAAPAKKAAARKPMSPANRKKLAALMKARWAKAKKAGATSLSQ